MGAGSVAAWEGETRHPLEKNAGAKHLLTIRKGSSLGRWACKSIRKHLIFLVF